MARFAANTTFFDISSTVAAASDHIINQRPGSTSRASGNQAGAGLPSPSDPITGARLTTTASQSLASPAGTTNTLLTGETQTLTTNLTQASATDRQLYIVFLDGPGQGYARGLAGRINSEFGINQPQDLLEHLNGFTAMLTAKQAERLKQSRGVRSIEADAVVSLVEPINRSDALAPSGSGTVSATGQITPYGISMVWGAKSGDYQIANNSAKYAFIFDTGVSRNTNDLNVNTTYSRNFTSTKTNDWIDYNGHGTHVAGTVAAVNNGVGVVGVAPGASVVSIRVLDRRGSGQTSWIVNGINYAAGLVKSGALSSSSISVSNLVANMSLGGGLNSSIDSAIRAAATDNGAGRYLRFAVAAGNSSADVDGFSPANTGDHSNIYTVSAVDGGNRMANFSNFDNLNDSSDDVDFSAPGVNVQSLGMSGGIVTMSGTSMAAPHVAGVLLMGSPIAGDTSTPVLTGAAGDPFALLA